MHLGINVCTLPHLCPFVFRTVMKLPHCQLFSFNVTIRLIFFPVSVYIAFISGSILKGLYNFF